MKRAIQIKRETAECYNELQECIREILLSEGFFYQEKIKNIYSTPEVERLRFGPCCATSH